MGTYKNESDVDEAVYSRLVDKMREAADNYRGPGAFSPVSAEQQESDELCAELARAVLETFDVLPKGTLRTEWGVKIMDEFGRTKIETEERGVKYTQESALKRSRRKRIFGILSQGIVNRLVSDWK